MSLPAEEKLEAFGYKRSKYLKKNGQEKIKNGEPRRLKNLRLDHECVLGLKPKITLTLTL